MPGEEVATPPLMDDTPAVASSDKLDTVEWEPMQTKSGFTSSLSFPMVVSGDQKILPRLVLIFATMFAIVISICTIIFSHQGTVICPDTMPSTGKEAPAMPPQVSNLPGNKRTVFATIVVGTVARSHPQDEICTSAHSAMRQHPGVPFYVFHDGQNLSPQALRDIWACGLITAQIHPELRRLILEAASIPLG